MRHMHVHYHGIDDSVVALTETYIRDICSSDQAMAEPTIDMRLNWLLTTLIIGMGECYFECHTDEERPIVGSVCLTCRTVTVRTYELSLEPETCLDMFKQQHQGHDYVVIYGEV